MTDRNQKIYRVTLTGSVVNMVLLVLKFVAGVLGHSSAMIADAIHSLSDFLTDIVVIVLVRISSRPADGDHHYGHGKYETIATTLIGMALMGVAVLLGWNGVEKIIGFFQGEAQQSPEMIALVAAVVSIVLKEWVFRITRRVAKDVDSQALEANAWHHRSDALSSVATAIGIGCAVMLGNGWAVLDPIAAVVVSIMIMVTALKLLRGAVGELLEESLPAETEEKIRQIVYEDPMVEDVHNLHTRKIGSRSAIEMHLRMPGEISLEEAHRRTCDIEQRLREEFGEGTHLMLHMEPHK